MTHSLIKNVQGYEHLSGIELIDQVYQDYNPKYIIAMFSGGHDSVTATHIASQHSSFSFVAHINTGIGIEETRQFVRDTCKNWGIDLKEYKASEYYQGNGKPDPQIYDELVLERGFPGPGKHHKMYERLKERPWRVLHRELDRDHKDKIMYITGMRQNESIRRMKHVNQVQLWEGTKIIVAPIWDFTKIDVGTYLTNNNLKRNPVVDMLHMSGECLCGAFARKGELDEIKAWGFTEVVNKIKKLEQEVMKKFPWKWGSGGPPDWWKKAKDGQTAMGIFAPEEYPAFLCVDCDNNQS